MKKLAAPRIFSLLLALILAVGLSPAALARVPDRPENKYVLDSAGVLSEDTERRIVAENQDLFEDCGAEIVVAAVDFLGGQDIKDYVYKMFNSWGIGSEERNNGILLVLAIGEENYRCQTGYGIDDYFNGELISGILDEYLEPDFAAEDYDAGVLKTFNALLDEVKGYYRTGPGRNDPAPGAEYSDDNWDEDRGFNMSPFRALKTIAIAILRVIVVVAVILFVFSLFRGPRGGGPGSGGGGGGFWRGMWLGSMMGNRRRGYWGAPPPPPPFGGPGPRPGGFGRGPGGFGGGGGFHGGGGSHGGGAGRH